MHALQYARTIRCERTIAVHLEEDPDRSARARRRVGGRGARRDARCGSCGAAATRRRACGGFLAAYEREDREVIVIAARPALPNDSERLSDRRAGARLNRALLAYPHVRVTLVRDHPEGVHPLQRDEEGRPVVRLQTRGRSTRSSCSWTSSTARRSRRSPTVSSSAPRSSAPSTRPPTRTGRPVLAQRWAELQAPVPLDVIECWDRDMPRALERYVVAIASDDQRGHGRHAAARLPEAPPAAAARPHQPQDPARARAIRARRRRRHPVLRQGAPHPTPAAVAAP